MTVSGYFLLHGPCYISPKACFYLQENHIRYQESGSLINCKLIWYHNGVSGIMIFKKKENNLFKILPRTGTVVDPYQYLGQKRSDS